MQEYTEMVQEALNHIPYRKIVQCIRWIQEATHLYTMGNGGSAMLASHIASDYRTYLRCTCLNDNVAAITSIANDDFYEEIFSNQLAFQADNDSTILCISTSGQSKNVIEAAHYGTDVGMTVIGWTGKDGGQLKDAVQLWIPVDSDDTQVIEDIHLVMGHMILKEL